MSDIIHLEMVSNNKGRKGAFFQHIIQNDAYIINGANMGTKWPRLSVLPPGELNQSTAESALGKRKCLDADTGLWVVDIRSS